jgi:hypothetical protein
MRHSVYLDWLFVRIDVCVSQITEDVCLPENYIILSNLKTHRVLARLRL